MNLSNGDKAVLIEDAYNADNVSCAMVDVFPFARKVSLTRLTNFLIQKYTTYLTFEKHVSP